MLDALRARAEADPDVLGLVLSGSQARGMGGPHSDHDVFVVVREHGGQWVRVRAGLDLAVLTVEELADTSDRWQRYAYRGAVVLLDRLDGRIAALVRAQGELAPSEVDGFVRENLDGYVNFVYRAAKSRRDGHDDLARLDEIEAAPWFMWTLFALYGRVRPYNKYLRWELDNHPLPAPWTVERLVPALTGRPSALFAPLERLARERGFGDVVDAWGDDLDLLR
ncbi:nucleotidyltransferase domain-containing protein [Asanoa sp. WMMD1127]|uniref:nucleotidyltransferase domain-containing protein n=1 Tax=Asanoa sp. WMMD1127 TaxID=3016107 RepID=UPI002417B377|nr:nucleotidyltransferase domain-containing protein [Asanoa sp. WMMD1127]MDG4826107.1 nucleotidyltransferase domain-containing protein [Asanoa sp. WMMD1127]